MQFDVILVHLRQSLLLHCCHEWDLQVSCSSHFHDLVLLVSGSNSFFFHRTQYLFLFFAAIAFSSRELVEVHAPMQFLVVCNEKVKIKIVLTILISQVHAYLTVGVGSSGDFNFSSSITFSIGSCSAGKMGRGGANML